MRVVLSGNAWSNVSQNAADARPHPGSAGAVDEVLGLVEVVEDVVGDVLVVVGLREVDVVELEVVDGAEPVEVGGSDEVDVDGAAVVLVVVDVLGAVDSGTVVVELDDDDDTSVVVELSAPQPSTGGT